MNRKECQYKDIWDLSKNIYILRESLEDVNVLEKVMRINSNINKLRASTDKVISQCNIEIKDLNTYFDNLKKYVSRGDFTIANFELTDLEDEIEDGLGMLERKIEDILED